MDRYDVGTDSEDYSDEEQSATKVRLALQSTTI